MSDEQRNRGERVGVGGRENAGREQSEAGGPEEYEHARHIEQQKADEDRDADRQEHQEEADAGG